MSDQEKLEIHRAKRRAQAARRREKKLKEKEQKGRRTILNESYYYSSLGEQEMDSYLQDCIDDSEEIQNNRDFLFANLFNRSGYRRT